MKRNGGRGSCRPGKIEGQHDRKIINIASIAGLRGAVREFQATGHHASKGWVITLRKDLACRWAVHNVHVNAIAPAWFSTNMSGMVIEGNQEALRKRIPPGRFGNGRDLKAAAIFLVSAASDFLTGHVLVVDGGQSAC
ncbi:MAG TPA: SDR family oxidoreductase [Candidatus Cybelea sp.]|nr:SDR family oxidoreductase [Candidatus Cybelea sp.]